MLTAIISGKAGRIQFDAGETRVSWREVFRRSEDLLTSVFFSRLRYLSEASLTRVMALLVGRDAGLGSLVKIEFWPHLTGTQGRSWVEPDVLMRFENALVMIEVKPPFGGGQYLDQWKAQIHALAQEFAQNSDDFPTRVHFVGLGRNTSTVSDSTYTHFDRQGFFDLTLHACEWIVLTVALSGLRVDATPSDLAVFDDWHKAFELFGIAQVHFGWPDLLSWGATHCDLSPDTLQSWPDLLVPTNPEKPPPSLTTWGDLLAFSAANQL